MARILTIPGPARQEGRPKVFLATPAYAAPAPEYTARLFESAQALAAAGIDAALEIYVGHCHVDDSRNRLVRDFLESDCTDLMFLDADNGWRPEDLVRLCGHARDVVGGTYPLKSEVEGYPVRLLQPAGQPVGYDAAGLVEVELMPTGFLRIARRVLEAMDAMAPHFEDKDHVPGQRMIPVIFERGLLGQRSSGDYYFCMKWRAMGGRVFLDPRCEMTHTGEKVWSGTWLDWFQRQNGQALGLALAAIGAGQDTADTFSTLSRVWGNPWAAPPEELAVLVGAVRGTAGLTDAAGKPLPILDVGSGLSSLVLAAACAEPRQVWALEHDMGFLARVRGEVRRVGVLDLNVCYAPLEPLDEGRNDPARDPHWYRLPPGLPACFGLIFVDGPPRYSHNGRAGILRALDLATALAPGGVLVMDDADESSAPLREAIEGLLGAKFEMVDGMSRPFAVLKRPVEDSEEWEPPDFEGGEEAEDWEPPDFEGAEPSTAATPLPEERNDASARPSLRLFKTEGAA